MKRTVTSLMVMAGMAALGWGRTPAAVVKPLAEQVRHELVMLPYYNVFDDLKFRIDNGTVTLLGAVTNPTVRSDAERVVKRLPGVAGVKNEIEVLPLSGFDNRIRLATYRALYSWPGLNRLASMAVPPVHIIVRNGNVTLEGIAPSKSDRDVAYLRAMSVSGVFSVTNNLAVEGAQTSTLPTK